MLPRRSTLLAAIATIFAPCLAWAQAHRPARPPSAPGRQRQPSTASGSPAQTPLGAIDTVAKFALAIDFNSGATLLDKGGEMPMPPSSMTKLMTAYLVYTALKSGRLKLTDELTVSERAWKMGGSKMFVQVGSLVKVEDLIRGMIVQSGNDACIVLAEALAGSEENFAEQMTVKARELGLTGSFFRNSTGWPDPSHRMSPRDLAMLARRIILDFPEYYHYDSEKSFKYNGIEQVNRNPLVQKGTADGLKTGHTEEGGYGLVASALRGGRRVILVINGLNSMRQRAEEADRLLEWCFREFEIVNLIKADDVLDKAPVWLGESPTVPLVTGRDLALTLPRNWRRNVQIALRFDTPVKAPVTKGDRLGTLAVSGQGVPPMDLPLLAGTDVPRLGLPGRAMGVLSRMLTKG
ncbi:MAG: D-alanyl-D-alanine carboxypeptidase [Acetobacteraceae bacterium]|nr:D-alanyl-D-alanine carboxypeptidase [Acetobacteraceae bacterium]